MRTEKILRQITETLLNNGFEDAVFIPAGEKGVERDTLFTLHREFGIPGGEASGEFFFTEEAGLPMLVCRLLMGEEIPEDLILPLCLEISLTNPELPLGAYAFDPVEGSLFYSFRMPLGGEFTEEELITETDACIALALSSAERFAGGLKAIIGE